MLFARHAWVLLFISKSQNRQKRIDGLLDLLWGPHNIGYKKAISEVEYAVFNLGITKRFGCNRIKFWSEIIIGSSLSTQTMYKILKTWSSLCASKIRTWACLGLIMTKRMKKWSSSKYNDTENTLALQLDSRKVGIIDGVCLLCSPAISGHHIDI
jgi:hypothetical protein